jgi:hypothetical protein
MQQMEPDDIPVHQSIEKLHQLGFSQFVVLRQYSGLADASIRGSVERESVLELALLQRRKVGCNPLNKASEERSVAPGLFNRYHSHIIGYLNVEDKRCNALRMIAGCLLVGRNDACRLKVAESGRQTVTVSYMWSARARSYLATEHFHGQHRLLQ